MSEFDEEAERERLRERFEREDRKREATERMSELLLKGATMTNAHCSDCGNPIFRYDGQEFCASCQKPVDRGDGEEAEGEQADAEETDGDDGPTNVEVASPSDDARVQFGGADASAEDDASDADPGESDAPTASDIESAVHGDEGSAGEPPRASAPPAEDAATAIATARADLAATLQRFARAARESDDPRTATAHLEAAREAAETLDELD